MAWSVISTVISGAVATAAWANQVKANFDESANAKVTTAGDMVYATGANALARLAAVASGQVLTSQGVGVAPAWASIAPLACRVYRSADSSFSGSSLLAWDSESFDTGALHDTVTNNSRLTMPAAGLVLLVAKLYYAPTPTTQSDFGLFIQKNGATLSAGTLHQGNASSGNHAVYATIVDQCAANDYYTVTATTTGSQTLVGGAAITQFEAMLWRS